MKQIFSEEGVIDIEKKLDKLGVIITREDLGGGEIVIGYKIPFVEGRLGKLIAELLGEIRLKEDFTFSVNLTNPQGGGVYISAGQLEKRTSEGDQKQPDTALDALNQAIDFAKNNPNLAEISFATIEISNMSAFL